MRTRGYDRQEDMGKKKALSYLHYCHNLPDILGVGSCILRPLLRYCQHVLWQLYCPENIDIVYDWDDT